MTKKRILLPMLFLFIVIGFMVRLPKIFHHYDKELHVGFYFLSAICTALFWSRWNGFKTFISVSSWSGFGIFIEYFQEYSNRFFTKRIHGKFDTEDLLANSIGIILFLGFWSIFKILMNAYSRIYTKKKEVTR